MAIQDAYSQVKPSVVAIIARYSTNPEFPTIFGTAFVAREDGLLLTCKHVVDRFPRLSGPADAPKDECPAQGLLFHSVPGQGMAQVLFEITNAFPMRKLVAKGYYYGPDVPDVAVLRVNIKGLPAVRLRTTPVPEEGDTVAISGFPMGSETLRAPGWVHQVSPTLQTGIVSAVLPFPCESPHGILVDVSTLGGASGSPLFDTDTGEVLGMVYGGLEEPRRMDGAAGLLIYTVPTSLAYAVPAQVLVDVLQAVDRELGKKAQLSDQIEFGALIEKAEFITVEPKTERSPMLEPWMGARAWQKRAKDDE